ncbi:taste receptor type 2 member 60 [Capricornis sumatraensis]|uniref:taste receptor type 2 member 60 n=1 Tax=Capricornis sumatraensis TaxID=34865 RepID=UPI0036051586
MSGGDVVPGPQVVDKTALICVVILFLLFLVALVGNGLIIAALGSEWLLRRTLSPCDKLLVSLGASRFCLQWVVISKNIYIFLNPTAFPYSPVFQLLAVQWDFLNSATLWFSTWLSVFYCVKIATFTHPIFLWLKRNVSGLVPWMLLSSLGFSTFTTVLFFIGNQRMYQNYLRRGLQSWNVTRNAVRTYERFCLFPLKIVTWTVPTVVFIAGTVLLITSLGRHTKKVVFSISGFHSSSAQAHIKALLAFISFAIFFTSSFLSLVLTASGMFPFGEFRFWIWQIVIYLGTAIHPIILLLSNRRLRALLGRGCSSAHGAS